MRLSGGSSLMNGRIEMCYSNVWFGICANSYSNYNNPEKICVYLGYSNQGINYNAIFYSLSHKIIVDATWYSNSFLDLPTLPLIPYEFGCKSTDQSFLDCYKFPINCYSLRYIYSYVYRGVRCTQGIYFLLLYYF